MNQIEIAKEQGRGYYTSVRDPDLNFNERGLNSRSALVSIGEEGDLSAPVMAVVHVDPGPGDPLRGRHLHHGDAINLVVDGAFCMDGTWLRSGQAEIIPAMHTYGDAISAEDGCIYIEIFDTHFGGTPEFHNPRDQKYYEEVHGRVYAPMLGRASPDQIAKRSSQPPRPVEIIRFDEPDDSWATMGEVSSKCVFIGNRNDRDAPAAIAIKAGREINDLIAGKRSFGTTTMMIVLSGSVMHDGRWMRTGEIYVAPPGEANGDLVFGPEGALLFIMFEKRSGMIPSFADATDQANFDKLLRSQVEDVASGKIEKSVSVLPLRDQHTPDKAIVFETIEAVEEYRAKMQRDPKKQVL